MRYVASLIALVVWVLPLSLQAVELRWNPDGIEKRIYHVATEIDITGSFDRLEPERLISDPAEFDKVIARLKRLPLKNEYMHYRARLKKRDGGRAIRVRMVGVPVTFEGEATDEREAELRELVGLYTDIIRLQGDMDLSGDSSNLTFYRSPFERNIFTQYFYLPKGDVVVGDHWRLPVKLFALGPGFFVRESASHNRVTLTAIRPSASGPVAELRYLVSEKVAGFSERLPRRPSDRYPFAATATFFGYGEFLVEKGCWLRQVMVADYTGSGYARVHKQQLFALELDKDGEGY